jgi:arylsulfatase A-like enzyme
VKSRYYVIRRNVVIRKSAIIKISAGIAASAAVTHAEDAANKPNVIFFLADDMGWADSTVYGSTFYETPAMERLAKSSVRFTQAYSASALCSPSRASIMSGQYPARHGMTSAWGHMPVDPDLPPYQDSIHRFQNSSVFWPVRLPSSKQVLDPEQYTLGELFRDNGYRTGFVGKWHMGLAPEYWPEEQGFETTFHGAPDAGPRSYFSPYLFQSGTVTDGPEGEYLTDRATDEALKFIRQEDSRPFFLCLWHWAVHGPWHAKPELIEYFRQRPDPRNIHRSPTMAAMLKSMDESLSRLLDHLEAAGLDDNTIIVFTSDNGGVVKKGAKGEEGIPATNNHPLRNGKASQFEGGTRVPLMIRWPGVADQEKVSDEIVTGVDFYPTLLEMCGLKPEQKQVLDGTSLFPALTGGELERDAIFHFFPWSFGAWSPAGAWVRQGDWKLIEVFNPTSAFPDSFELYNLKKDPAETTNLAEVHPERVDAMKKRLQQHYRETGARMPVPKPDYNGKLQQIGKPKNEL